MEKKSHRHQSFRDSQTYMCRVPWRGRSGAPQLTGGVSDRTNYMAWMVEEALRLRRGSVTARNRNPHTC